MMDINQIIESLDNSAKNLFHLKQYKSAADILAICTQLVNNKEVLNKICANARMCYFMANDVINAYKFLTMQELTGIDNGWELVRDKANYLRYLDQHQYAYELANTIADDKTRNLAVSWFLHKEGKIKEGFLATELSRKNNYWWKNTPTYSYKLWDKQKVNNLVIIAESGWGDEIIFSRWIEDLKLYSENIYYDGLGSLPDVFARNFNIKLFDRNKEYIDLYGVPVMSLPFILNIECPQQDQYITSIPELVDRYNTNYPKDKKRIGICFHGEKTHIESTLRSLPPKELIDSVIKFGEVISLQKDNDIFDDRILKIPFTTWDDTLALLDTCDIIISCDTSVAHAAAALGKTTIVLMHSAAYFTWNHNENISKSLWYKDAWCIHQDKPCDWEGAINNCGDLVNKLLGEKYEA